MTQRKPLRLEYVDPQTLSPNPLNWRTHPDRQKVALSESMNAVGWAGAMLFNERTGHLVDGHARLELAGTEPVPVLIGDWSDEEERLILATLDPIAALAGVEATKLQELTAGVPLDDTRALQELVARLLSENRPPRPGNGDPDAIPEAPEPITQPGDLWQLGPHRLLCGDSTNPDDVARLMDGATPRLLLTDPPYGVDYQGSGNPRWKQGRAPIANDNLGDGQSAFWEAAFGAAPLEGDCYVFSPSGNLMIPLALAVQSAGIDHHQWLVWVKQQLVLGRGHYHYRHEHIWYGWRGRSSWQGSRTEDSVWEAPRPAKSEEHPTMKPVVLMERAITNSSLFGDVVYDPFVGSGTTLIAAARLGRRAFVMEVAPGYCDVVVKRWENFTGERAVRLEA